MSEYLLLSVYTRYLESQGFEIQRKVSLASGTVDVLAKSGDRTLLAETKWVRSPGDVFEVIGRAVQNLLAMPNATPVVVLPVGVTTEGVRERILGPSYKYGIEVHYVDVNNRQVFPDYITTQLFPAIHALISTGRKFLGQKFSRPQARAVYSMVSSLQTIKEPLELVDDITDFLNECQKVTK